MSFDAYLKIEAIKGSAQAKGNVDEIPLFSFSWGAANPISVTVEKGLAAGKVNLTSFNLMKKSDKASPILFQYCCNGTHIDKCVVSLRKSGGTDMLTFIKYKFTNCMIESIQWSGSGGGDDTPSESVSIAFEKVELMYQPQGKDGAKDGAEIPASWDVKTVAKS